MIALSVAGLAALSGLVSSVPLPDGIIGHGGHGGHVVSSPVVHAVHSTPVVVSHEVSHGGYQENYQPDPFSFTYGVHDDHYYTDFSESRHGDAQGNIKGEYSVALPDGRIQYVTYTADGGYGGTVMEVSYMGEARHPEAVHSTPVVHEVVSTPVISTPVISHGVSHGVSSGHLGGNGLIGSSVGPLGGGISGGIGGGIRGGLVGR